MESVDDILNAIENTYSQLYTRDNMDFEKLGSEIPLPYFEYPRLYPIIDQATQHLKSQQTLLRLGPDIYIIGDLHGNIIDLIRIFAICGNPKQTRYLFLGDYIDRGPYSLEVITLLLALMLKYPQNIYLIRGNHEFEDVSREYGFYAQILSEDLFQKFQVLFSFLPIATVIDNKVFCVHGGLSPQLSSLADIENIHRPIESTETELLVHLMWSDPSNIIDAISPSPRGQGILFGSTITQTFLKNNGLAKIIRAHQCVACGVESFHNGLGITVFSSSNYCNVKENKCGILKYQKDGQIDSFHLPAIKIKDPCPTIAAKALGIYSPQRRLGSDKKPIQQRGSFSHAPPGKIRKSGSLIGQIQKPVFKRRMSSNAIFTGIETKSGSPLVELHE